MFQPPPSESFHPSYEVLSVRRSSIQLYRDIIEVNVIGVIRACQAVTPIMRSQGQGTIVNIGSLSGIIAEPGVNAYACSKHALEGVFLFSVSGMI
jgi:short-subunit dehydrogenase